MKEFFMELATGQGIWTALSIILIFYIIKKEEVRDQKQEQREINYQKIIDELSTKLNIVLEIRVIGQAHPSTEKDYYWLLLSRILRSGYGGQAPYL